MDWRLNYSIHNFGVQIAVCATLWVLYLESLTHAHTPGTPHIIYAIAKCVENEMNNKKKNGKNF